MIPQRLDPTDCLADRRVSRRVRVCCDASLKTMSRQMTGQLIDISREGAKFRTGFPPREGSTALLAWAEREVVCTVAWMRDDTCGLIFAEPISAAAVAETEDHERIAELPVASVGNIALGRRRGASEPIAPPPPMPQCTAAGGDLSFAQILARYKRTGSWTA